MAVFVANEPYAEGSSFGAASWAIAAAYTRENILGESWLTSGKPNFEGREVDKPNDAAGAMPRTQILETWWRPSPGWWL